MVLLMASNIQLTYPYLVKIMVFTRQKYMYIRRNQESRCIQPFWPYLTYVSLNTWCLISLERVLKVHQN